MRLKNSAVSQTSNDWSSLDAPKHGGNLAWAATLAGCSPADLLDFSASINPLGPPAAAIAAIQDHLDDLCHYPDPENRSLRQCLSQFHNIPPDWILIGNGSAELLTWAGRELAALPATLLPTPAFADYDRALSAFGATVQRCPLELSPSFPIALPNLPALPNAGLLLNNPHNPSGGWLDAPTLLPQLDRFALVVLDEAFLDFLPPAQQESLIPHALERDNLVVLRSLTKFYSLPGLRLGYAIAHPDRLRRWQQWRDPWSVNVLASAAAVAAIEDVAFQQATWDWLPPARSQLFAQLAGLPGLQPFPSVANFLLVKTDRSARALQQRLLTQDRLLIRDCCSFPELGDRYFRVAVRTQPENQRLVAALAQALNFLR